MRRIIAMTAAAGVLAAGCTETFQGSPESTLTPFPPASTLPEILPPTTLTATETTPPASLVPETIVPVSTENTPSTPPPTFALPEDIFNPPCAVQVQPGDTLTLIAQNAGINLPDLMTENDITNPDRINAFDPLDICIDGIDDLVTGQPRVAATTVPPVTQPTETTAPASTTPPELASGVEAQQAQLNALFGPYGMPPLVVDGESGPLTDQQNCAARVALGLPASRADMTPGSEEEILLMTTANLPIPQAPAVNAGKWIVIEQGCQVMFVGQDDTLVYVFPTSTGQPEFPTRNGTHRTHRYDPALENNGWHDSTAYPATEDNPLNGNMYKPIYFDRGQAIHGANNVPPNPASHGCARTRVSDHDLLIRWLGLSDQTVQTFDLSKIVDLEVTVQGSY